MLVLGSQCVWTLGVLFGDFGWRAADVGCHLAAWFMNHITKQFAGWFSKFGIFIGLLLRVVLRYGLILIQSNRKHL